MTAPLGFEGTLRSFRQAFDQTFAAPPINRVETFEGLLAIRVAGDPYALRVREIRGVVASRRVVPLPSPKPELLGVAGIRGSLVAVYSLAALLGHGADGKAPSWIALAGAAEPVGLAFEGLDGFVRVRAADLSAPQPGNGARPHVGELALVQGQSRRIVDLPSTLAALEAHAGSAGSAKESR